jgi:hypothetical protein
MLETGIPLTHAYSAAVRSSALHRTLLLACIVLGASSCGGRIADWTVSNRGGTARDETPTPAPAPLPAAASAAGRSGNPSESGPSPVPQKKESCAENPLLAMCVSSTPAPSPVPAEPLAVPALGPPAASELVRVESVLAERCGNCHGGEPTPERCGTCDGMYYVENLRRLIEAGDVSPCNWRGSLVYRRINDGSMPPPSSGQSGLTASEQKLVGNFVDGMCDDFIDRDGPPDTQRAEIERWLSADCGSCHGPADGDEASAPNGLIQAWDLEALLEAGRIVPCNADGSLLVQMLRDDSMPPPGASPRPSPAQLRELISFIGRPCSRR